jgi:hypothetical protein
MEQYIKDAPKVKPGPALPERRGETGGGSGKIGSGEMGREEV